MTYHPSTISLCGGGVMKIDLTKGGNTVNIAVTIWVLSLAYLNYAKATKILKKLAPKD